MIGTLRGILSIKRPEGIIVETCGVGYRVSVPLNVLSDLPDTGNKIFLYIYTYVKDDAIELYGFLDEKGKEVFKSLLKINGVGPKLALNILSSISVDDFLYAVESEDIGLLTRLPRVGRKTAQRIILDLKGRLPSGTKKVDRVYEDTISALLNLGYKKLHAKEALEKVYQKGLQDIETLLKESLKYLNK